MANRWVVGVVLAAWVPLACAEDTRDPDLFGSDSDGASDAGEDSADGGSASDGSGSGSDGSGGSDDGAGEDDGGGEDTSDGGDDGVLLDIGGDGGDSGGDGGSQAGCQSIDVLFIVDISASMGEEKDNLEANFQNFVDVLDGYIADPMSGATGYRIGVTNSSFVNNAEGESTFGLDGELYDGEANFLGDCGLNGAKWFDGPAPGIAETFACVGRQPKSPCTSCSDIGKERPLDAIGGFVDKSAPGGPNDGFYRGDSSLLVVVILTDEDDDAVNTTTTPQATKLALDGFTGNEERYVVVTVAGPQAAGCDSAFGSAAPAPILHEFTGLVPNGYMGDICLGDLSTSLNDALSLIQTSCDTFPPVD